MVVANRKEGETSEKVGMFQGQVVSLTGASFADWFYKETYTICDARGEGEDGVVHWIVGASNEQVNIVSNAQPTIQLIS